MKLIVVKRYGGSSIMILFETLYFQYKKGRLRTSLQNNPNYTALLSTIDLGSLQSFVFLLQSNVRQWRQCQCCCLHVWFSSLIHLLPLIVTYEQLCIAAVWFLATDNPKTSYTELQMTKWRQFEQCEQRITPGTCEMVPFETYVRKIWHIPRWPSDQRLTLSQHIWVTEVKSTMKALSLKGSLF